MNTSRLKLFTSTHTELVLNSSAATSKKMYTQKERERERNITALKHSTTFLELHKIITVNLIHNLLISARYSNNVTKLTAIPSAHRN
jgi:prolyl-tRNA synthetase